MALNKVSGMKYCIIIYEPLSFVTPRVQRKYKLGKR